MTGTAALINLIRRCCCGPGEPICFIVFSPCPDNSCNGPECSAATQFSIACPDWEQAYGDLPLVGDAYRIRFVGAMNPNPCCYFVEFISTTTGPNPRTPDDLETIESIGTCENCCPEIPTGACCFDDGSCSDDVTEADCLGVLGGAIWTEGEVCDDVDCPADPPPGACGLCPDGNCPSGLIMIPAMPAPGPSGCCSSCGWEAFDLPTTPCAQQDYPQVVHSCGSSTQVSIACLDFWQFEFSPGQCGSPGNPAAEVRWRIEIAVTDCFGCESRAQYIKSDNSFCKIGTYTKCGEFYNGCCDPPQFPGSVAVA